jgi:eukaryotic-like serine/threonine-protein kinase
VALTPGVRIAGRFEIVAPLGAGSMGEVYHAHDVKLQRHVALKLLSLALATSEEHLARFEREARAASGLNHPNICTIYDVGQAAEADGRPYLVMELLRGQTLHEILATGPLAIATVVALGLQIATALDVAHTAGIIHRDIKPANIFVTTRGDAKLLDFGLAAVTAPSDVSASLTNPGTAVGTVLYMSPEQALGDPLDGRTDIFSLGVVMYEMITGRRAFDGRSTTAIVDAILHAHPADLGVAEPSIVPRDLRRLLARMLDKDRERRPASAAEVAAQLHATQSGSIAGREYAATESASTDVGVGSSVIRHVPDYASTPAPDTSGMTRTFDSMSFEDVGPFVLACLILAAIAYGAYAWYERSRPVAVAREALLLADFVNTTGEPVFDGALKDALEIQLQQSPYLNILPASQVRSTLQSMQRSPTEPISSALAHELCQRAGAKAVLFGSIAPLASAYIVKLEAQSCGVGDVIAREQVQAAAKTDVLPGVGAAAARLRKTLGESIGSIQRFNVPIQNATTASLDALKAYSMGIETRTRTGEVQAIPLFERALELDPNFALAAARLAAVHANLEDHDKAQEYIKRAFEHSEGISEPERLSIRSAYQYIVTGRLDDVVATYQLWIRTYPQDWVPHNNLATTYVRLNELDDALREARTAVQLAPNVVVPYQELARILLVLDRFADCAAVIADAEAHSLDSSYNRAIAYDLAFINNDAAAMQEQLRAASSRADGHLVVAEAARAALAAGDLETSRRLYAQAISAARSAEISDYAGLLLAEQSLGDALLGDPARADRERQEALQVGSGGDALWTAALAAAFAGHPVEAAALASRYQSSPPAPDIVRAYTPALASAVALANHDARSAVDVLNDAAAFERSAGPWIPYLRGLGYEALNDPRRAASEFQTVIAHRGVQATSLVRTLARRRLTAGAPR